MVNNEKKLEFWSIPTSEILKKLQITTDGLKSSEVRERLNRYGANVLKPKKRSDTFKFLLSKFKSPITLILIFASGLFFSRRCHRYCNYHNYYSDQWSAEFLAGKRSSDAFEKLLAAVQIKAAVLRDGKETEIPLEEIVPGDVIILNAGDIIPADCLYSRIKRSVC